MSGPSPPGSTAPAAGMLHLEGYQQHPSTPSRGRKRSKISRSNDELLEDILPTPREAQCILRLRFEPNPGSKCRDHQPQKIVGWTWNLKEPYGQLAEGIAQSLDDYREQIRKSGQFPGIKVYRSYGSCRVIGKKNEGPHSIVEDYDADNLRLHAIQNICGFIYKYPFEPFRLEFRLHFSTIRQKPGSSPWDYQEMVLPQIRQLLRTDQLLGQAFLPRVHRNQLTTQHILGGILKQRRHGSDMDSERICKDIVNQGASILFIACLYSHVTIETILHWIQDHGYNDINLPRAEEVQVDCPWQKENCVQVIKAHLNVFFARTISRDGKRHVLDSHEIMPILNIAPLPHTQNGISGRTETVLGNGSFGKVTAVKIEPSHHDLTGDPDRTFALKKFIASGHPPPTFRREFSMLERLFHKQHPHLVTHITSWSQGDGHYILYPRAKRNLRSHMKEYDPPGRSGDDVAWLFRQLHGLASGLRCIHEMGEVAANFPDQLDTPTEGNEEVNKLQYGYHHDIKPENILIFEHFEDDDPDKFGDQNPVFKLSDFGAGRFHTMSRGANKPSQASSNLHGTMSYYGPEYRQRRSRPFDIWAMACVYFEVMIWYCLPSHHLDKFQAARSNQTFGTPEFSHDFFWIKVPGGEAELSPVVVEYFTLLEAEINKDDDSVKALLAELLILVRSCFQIDHTKRPKVQTLCDKLHELQARADTGLERAQIGLSAPAVAGNAGSDDVSDAADRGQWSPTPRSFTL